MGGGLMNVAIMVCGCGLRVRAPDATPGRVGRCPNCGGELRVPDLPPPVAKRALPATDGGGGGYGLERVKEPTVRSRRPARPAEVTPPRASFIERKAAAPMADGLLPTLERSETSWFASFLYPLRGADSLAVIASLSAILWLFTILVPEYCITLMGDADGMGAATLGKLIALVSILPVAFLLPFALLYWLQYLGRVVVASGMGETIPPRSPDRNFEGVFSGLSPWIVWLFLGLGVGLLPVALCRLLLGSENAGSLLVALGIGFCCLPYILTALLLSFLHDDALAAKPPGVLNALVQLGGSFFFLAIFIGFAIAAGAGAFLLAFLLRGSHFVLYLLSCGACWMTFVWVSIVVMRVLGNHYHRHRQVLRWNQERPRWGVAWKL
jgi:hypothetical protein